MNKQAQHQTEKDTHVTEVVFRRYENGEIIALMPYDIQTREFLINSYQHIGQHSQADYNWVVQRTYPATEAEYKSLQIELEAIGYKVKPIKRYNSNKYIQAVNDFLRK